MIDKCNMRQVTLLLFRFFGQNVTLERVFAFQFTCSGKRKALFGTGISFYFWHFVKYLILLIIGSRQHKSPDTVSLISQSWLIYLRLFLGSANLG